MTQNTYKLDSQRGEVDSSKKVLALTWWNCSSKKKITTKAPEKDCRCSRTIVYNIYNGMDVVGINKYICSRSRAFKIRLKSTTFVTNDYYCFNYIFWVSTCGSTALISFIIRGEDPNMGPLLLFLNIFLPFGKFDLHFGVHLAQILIHTIQYCIVAKNINCQYCELHKVIGIWARIKNDIYNAPI